MVYNETVEGIVSSYGRVDDGTHFNLVLANHLILLWSNLASIASDAFSMFEHVAALANLDGT